MEHPNLESIQDWEMETLDTHTRPVPKMPREERGLWHNLKNKQLESRVGGHRLSLQEGKLLFALNRKLRYRTAFERLDA